jgi:hypothetical protein
MKWFAKPDGKLNHTRFLMLLLIIAAISLVSAICFPVVHHCLSPINDWTLDIARTNSTHARTNSN